MAKLIELPIRIRAEWPPEHTAGCWPIAPMKLISKDMLHRVSEGMPRVKLVKDFPGGIRVPHLHAGDEVILLDAARFKEVVAPIAAELAGNLAETGQYAETVGAVRGLVPHG